MGEDRAFYTRKEKDGCFRKKGEEEKGREEIFQQGMSGTDVSVGNEMKMFLHERRR